jgi:hypothetical protein
MRKEEILLLENLVDLCHENWFNWMKYLYSKSKRLKNGDVVIPKELNERWEREMNTGYKDLIELEKNSVRKEALDFWNILKVMPNIWK